MAKILNPRTLKTVLEILDQYTDPEKNDQLILAIARRLPDREYKTALKLLKNLKAGILDK
jgi:hypothetical protein